MIPAGEDRRLPFFPFVVYALIALNVFVFVREAQAADVDRFINAFAVIPYDVTHGVVLAPPSPPFPPLTILTSMFLHGGLLHIAFNMLVLFAFGPEVEYACGHLRFAAFYVLCGIAGGIAQVAVAPGSHVPEIGASGAIAGVLGAYVVAYPLRLGALLVIGAWAVTQFADGFGALSARTAEAAGGTAYFAHIGGFSCGVLTIGLFGGRQPGSRRSRR